MKANRPAIVLFWLWHSKCELCALSIRTLL